MLLVLSLYGNNSLWMQEDLLWCCFWGSSCSCAAAAVVVADATAPRVGVGSRAGLWSPTTVQLGTADFCFCFCFFGILFLFVYYSFFWTPQLVTHRVGRTGLIQAPFPLYSCCFYERGINWTIFGGTRFSPQDVGWVAPIRPRTCESAGRGRKKRRRREIGCDDGRVCLFTHAEGGWYKIHQALFSLISLLSPSR